MTTDEIAAAIEANMLGVTPGEWKEVSDPHFDSGLVYTSVQPVIIDEDAMKPLAMANGEYHVCRMSHSAAEWRFSLHRVNATHIALCDPANISALLSERKAMRDEIERLQIGGWRPIETAPKDETFIDIWSSRHGRLTDYWRVARSSENVFYTTDVGFACVRDASHWMPIPSQSDITDDIMKAANEIAAKACSESHSAQGKGSILAASPFDCALRAAEASLLAERIRCVDSVLAWGSAKERAGPLSYAADDIAAAIMKGPTT